MTRSSTMSCAILAAACGVMEGSNAITFEAMLTEGMDGRIQTRADAELGAEFPAGGSAKIALSETHPATAGPVPTVRVTVGVDPSASPAAASGPWVDRSAATGMEPTSNIATAKPTGNRQPKWKKSRLSLTPSARNGARKLTSANRSAQAMTRLARIAVLVQNSSVVGPSNSTASRATPTPNTTLANGASGTVLGSGIMNRAKISISGDVTRICHSSRPHMGVTCQLATMQWSGTGASARATNTANATMKPSSRPSSRSSHAMRSPPTIRIAYVTIIHGPIGIHHRSSGSVYFGPRTTNAITSATLDGLKMWRPRHRIRYFVAIPSATTPMKIQIP